MKNHNCGFLGTALLIIIALALIGGGVYMATRNKPNASVASISTNGTTSADWKLYSNPKDKFSFKYPSDFITNYQSDSEVALGTPRTASSSYSLGMMVGDFDCNDKASWFVHSDPNVDVNKVAVESSVVSNMSAFEITYLGCVAAASGSGISCVARRSVCLSAKPSIILSFGDYGFNGNSATSSPVGTIGKSADEVPLPLFDQILSTFQLIK